MQRLRDERGAVGVMVALLMVPLIGFAAIAIDVAAMYAERQQLQTGADAGALAVAQDCARVRVADRPAPQGVRGRQPTKATPTDRDAARARQGDVRNPGVKQNRFAPVLGVAPSTISASATAAWGSPISGTAVLPLAFSWCEWKHRPVVGCRREPATRSSR